MRRLLLVTALAVAGGFAVGLIATEYVYEWLDRGNGDRR